MDVRSLLKQGIDSARAGEKDKARAILHQVVAEDPDNLAAWLWLSDLAETPQERLTALDNALKLDSNQPQIQKRLEEAMNEVNASQEQMISDLRKVFVDQAESPVHSRPEQAGNSAFRENQDDQNDGSAVAKSQASSSTRLIIRLSSAPILLYFILVLIQGGIDFRTLDLVLVLGTFLVIPGSLLLTIAIVRPIHPGWVPIFAFLGPKREGWMHFVVGSIGAVLLILPYTVLILNIIARAEWLRWAGH